MAITRGANGKSTPRVPFVVSTDPSRKTTTGRKKTTTTTKKPATKKTTTGRVTKKAPATHHKRKPSVKDKVEGSVKKAVGKVERKPGKVGAGTKQKKGTDGKGGKKL
jgi:hypothetical protein